MNRKESNEIGSKQYNELLKVVWLIAIPLTIVTYKLGIMGYMVFLFIYSLIINNHLCEYSYNKYVKTIKQFADGVCHKPYYENHGIGGYIPEKDISEMTKEEIIKGVDYLVDVGWSEGYVTFTINKVSSEMLSSDEVKSLIVEEAIKRSIKKKKRIELIDRVIRIFIKEKKNED